MNKVMIVGRTTKDIIGNAFPDGKAFCFFSIADDDSYTDRKTKKRVKRTHFHNCRMTGGIVGTMVKYVGKGSMIALEGKVTYSESEKDGKKYRNTTVLVTNIEFLDTKKPAGAAIAGTADNAAIIAALIASGMSLEEAKKAIAKKVTKSSTAAPTVVDESDAIPFDE